MWQVAYTATEREAATVIKVAWQVQDVLILSHDAPAKPRAFHFTPPLTRCAINETRGVHGCHGVDNTGTPWNGCAVDAAPYGDRLDQLTRRSALCFCFPPQRRGRAVATRHHFTSSESDLPVTCGGKYIRPVTFTSKQDGDAGTGCPAPGRRCQKRN